MRAIFFTALFVLLAGFSSVHAQTQSDFIYLQDRVQRLEAQLGSGGSNLAPQTEAGLSLRIDQLEERVRVMTGQVEEARFKTQALEEQLRRFQEDTEFRFRELQGGGISAIPDNTPLNPGPVEIPELTDPVGGTLSGTLEGGVIDGTLLSGNGLTAERLGAPPQSLGGNEQFNDGLAGRPLDLNALASQNGGFAQDGQRAANGQDLALATPSDPRAEFELGYSLVIARDYAGAEGAFRQFLATYPGHALEPDARYWIGESQFQRGAYRNAADTYLELYTRFGTSPQAAPSLLRLAQSLNELGETRAACTTVGELKNKYSNSVPTVAERADQDARAWGC